MSSRAIGLTILALMFSLIGCRNETVDPLPPDEYLDSALDWIATHAANGQGVDWQTVKREAVAMVPSPETTFDTYPAIEYALEQLEGGIGYLVDAQSMEDFTNLDVGLAVVYPEAIVVRVDADSPADRAGIRIGDLVESINGEGVKPWVAPPGRPRRPDTYYARWANIPEEGPVDIVFDRPGSGTMSLTLEPDRQQVTNEPIGRRLSLGSKTIGYVDLVLTFGALDYPTQAQQAMRDVDDVTNCGWIIDLRRNSGGDLWSYLSAIGPILGEGEVGSFLYPNGTIEAWVYEDGKVYWAGDERFESYVRGPIFAPQNPAAPVALLTSRLTHDAGELVVVAFRGRGNVRTFGETTAGVPHLNLWTPLSDGAGLGVSGAIGRDRNGRVYDAPIIPDKPTSIDWQRFGKDDDPTIMAAETWLAEQPDCGG